MNRLGAHVGRLGAATLAGLLATLPAWPQVARPRPPSAEPSAAPAHAAASLQVAVTDEAGEPVEGAVVVVVPSSGGYLPFGGLDPAKARTSVTGAKGRATLDSIGPGPWSVTVQARGLAPRTTRRVEGGVLEVRLEKGGVITGVVADAEGVPLPDVRVSLDTGLPLPSAWADEASRVESTTDAEGRFRLEGIGPRPVTVTARAPGFGRSSRDGVEAGAHVELFLFPGAALAGTVVDAEGLPIEGALVQAAGGGLWTRPPPSERTDASGRFVMAGVEDGEYVVMAREGSRAPGLGRAVVESESEAFVEVTLSEGGFVTGRAVDTDGRPVGGQAEVAAFDGLNLPDFVREALTSEARAAGAFVLGPLPIGALEIAVSAPGHAPERVEAAVPGPGSSVDLGEVVLDAGLAIRGRVVDAEGNGVAAAVVRAQAQFTGPPKPQSEERADDAGTFEVTGLEEGPYQVTASAPGFAAARVSARAGDEGLELTLETAGEVRGHVVDADGAPVSEARVTARRSDGAPSPRFRGEVFATAEDDEGRFVLRDVAAGTWVLQAGARGRGEASVPEVRVSAGRTTDVGTVVLARGGVIRGTVVDVDGSGVPGATVQAQQDVSSLTSRLQTQSRSAGTFELRGVPPGRLSVFASHPAFAACPPKVVEVDPQSDPEPVRLVLARGGRVEGFAFHRDGRPFTEGRVMAWGIGSDRAGAGSEGVAIGPDGWYSADHLPPGRTMVNLLAFTSSSPHMVGPMQTLTGVASREIEVRDGETATVDFRLRDVIVAGQVTRGGEAASGIRVTLMGRMAMALGYVGPPSPRAVAFGPPPLTAVTRADGHYELLVYEPGRFQVQLQDQVGGQGYPGREVDVPDVEMFELNLQLADATVSGVLVDAETGEPLSEGGVQLTGAGPVGTWAGGGSTGPDGRFTLTVEPGDYHLSARARGRKSVSMDVSVGASGLDDLRIEMERGLEVRGRVVDPAGRPVGGVSVAATDSDGQTGGHTRTLPDGTFRLDGLARGPFTLAAGGELAGFSIRPGVRPTEEPVILKLQPGGRVAVRVLDPAGRPAKDVWPDIRAVGGVRVSVPGLHFGPTNAAGLTEIVSPAGMVEIEARGDRQSGTGTATVRPNATSSVEIVLKPRASAP